MYKVLLTIGLGLLGLISNAIEFAFLYFCFALYYVNFDLRVWDAGSRFFFVLIWVVSVILTYVIMAMFCGTMYEAAEAADAKRTVK